MASGGESHDDPLDEVEALRQHVSSLLGSLNADTAASVASDTAPAMANTSIPILADEVLSLPVFLDEHNVAEALRRANTLHAQRVGHPAVLQTRFAPTGNIGGSTAFSWEGHLHSLDLLPSPGLTLQESSSVESVESYPQSWSKKLEPWPQ